MNKIMILGVAAVLLIVGGVFFFINQNQTSQPSSTTQEEQIVQKDESTVGNVEIKNFAFSPSSITVKVGDTVTWTNKDSTGHSATADDNSFDTGVLDSGTSGTVTFSKAGTYTYHCTPHPNMKATVIVE